MKCDYSECHNPALPGCRYCSEKCRRSAYYIKHKRGIGHERGPRGVVVQPPDVCLPYRVTKAEWELTRYEYPRGTVYVMDGVKMVL